MNTFAEQKNRGEFLSRLYDTQLEERRCDSRPRGGLPHKSSLFGDLFPANVSTVGDRHSLIMLDIDKVNTDYNPVTRQIGQE
jgi:hypothetical protein